LPQSPPPDKGLPARAWLGWGTVYLACRTGRESPPVPGEHEGPTTREQTAAGPRRAVSLRRSYLFLPGADVLIHDLEDFTPPQRLPEARALAAAEGTGPAW